MRRIGLLGAALTLILGVSLAAFHPALAGTTKLKVTGTVTAVSTSSIKVTTTGTSPTATTFVVNTKTHTYAKYGGTETIGSVSVGDTVTVEGTSITTTSVIGDTHRVGAVVSLANSTNTVTITTNTATKITDKSIWRAKLQGVVSDLDTSAMTFNLVVSKPINELGVNATYNEANRGNGLTKIQQTTITKTSTSRTVTTVNNKAWTDMANGQKVWTNGLWNSVKQSLKDSYITLPTITVK